MLRTISKVKTLTGKFFTGEATLQDVLHEVQEEASEEADQDTVDATLRARLVRQASRNPNDDLQHGAMRGDIKKVKRALAAHADPLQPNLRGVTPLMLSASSSGKEALEVIKEVINGKANISSKDHNGWTAIHHACRNGKVEAAKLLMSLNSDAAAKTNDDKTTLMLTTMEGKAELFKELMKDKKCQNQVADRDALSVTALHYAVKGGYLDIAKLLIEHSAKVNAKDIDSKTPLMWACEHGTLDCVRTLSKKSADIDVKDKCHRSALLYACLNSYEGVALWLVRKGADPYQPDVEGESPLTVADDMGLADLKRTVKMQRIQAEATEE